MRKTKSKKSPVAPFAASDVQRDAPLAALARTMGGVARELRAAETQPMLCDRAPVSLSLPGYLYELKLDGVRILAEKGADGTELYYRSGRRATSSYPEIAEAVSRLGVDRVILDGEIIAFDEHGLPSFERLQRRIGEAHASRASLARAEPVAFIAFDVLSVDGVDVMPVPLMQRRELLARIVPEGAEVTRFPAAVGDGTALLALCKERGMEGLVAKRPDSRYAPGERGSAWSKIKITRAADFVVIGFTRGEIGKRRLRALSLASFEDGRLRYRGDVGSGFDDAELTAFEAALASLTLPAGAPMPDVRGLDRDRARVLVRPEIIVRVEFQSVLAEGVLRFPVFKGLRPDLAVRDCELGE